MREKCLTHTMYDEFIPALIGWLMESVIGLELGIGVRCKSVQDTY